jgi:hypothetical protein
MCLYALEVAAGRLAGPYSDAQALAYCARRRPSATELRLRSTPAHLFGLAEGVLIADPVPGLRKPEDGKERTA